MSRDWARRAAVAAAVLASAGTVPRGLAGWDAGAWFEGERGVEERLAGEVAQYARAGVGPAAFDALGVADRLLASGGSSPAPLALVAALLVVRLLIYFVAPGVVIGALLHALLTRERPG